jgi:glyoxylase-like metal-dependent hydrolase (beta-lactamase superfamily II)
MQSPVTVPEWAAEELAARLEGDEEIHVLDVRAPHRLESGRIDTAPSGRFHNIRGSELMALEDASRVDLPSSVPIVVVCGRGNDSRAVASRLGALGFRCASLAGGMNAWMTVSLPREVTPPPGCDRLLQFDRVGKGALAYAVISDGEALIVDPPRQTDALLAAIGESTRVIGVADTHVHADYISGSASLSRALGVPYFLHPADAQDPYDGTPGTVPFTGVRDGQEIPVGSARVRVFHTPGHTMGSVTYLVNEATALTGDFVFLESVGRPDLGEQAEVWAKVLWRSLERARAEWPATLIVRPGHYASETERNEDRSFGRTFERVRATNGTLRLATEDDFLDWMLDRAGSFPDAYRRIKAINVGLDHPTEAEMEELEAGRNQCALG